MTSHPVACFERLRHGSFIQRTPRPRQFHWRKQDSERINRMDDRELCDRIAAAMQRNGGAA